MAELAIRVPSVEALFDAWSAEPLARLIEWLLEKEPTCRPESAASVARALRGLAGSSAPSPTPTSLTGMETMAVDSRRHWIRRSLRPRESRIGIALFFVALVLAALIDYGDTGDSFFGQVFVVLGWVALWGPAYRLITAASFRLARRRFAELARAEVRISWGPD